MPAPVMVSFGGDPEVHHIADPIYWADIQGSWPRRLDGAPIPMMCGQNGVREGHQPMIFVQNSGWMERLLGTVCVDCQFALGQWLRGAG